MVTKKKVMNKKKEPFVLEAEVIRKSESIIENPKIEFKSFTITKTDSIELNYVGIRRNIINFGKKIGLILTKEQKEDKKIKLNETKIYAVDKTLKIRNKIYSFWLKYSNWWNLNFNKGV